MSCLLRPAFALEPGQLDGGYGRSMVTAGRQPTHTTVWPHVGVDRVAPFRRVTPVRRAP